MTRMKIEQQVKKTIIDSLCLDINESLITPATAILEDLQFDSILFVKFIVALEEDLGIEIDDEDLNVEKFETFEIFIDLLSNKYLKAELEG